MRLKLAIIITTYSTFMSEGPGKLKISDLNHDILWTIFKLCATDSNESPPNRLTLTRRASQVCSTWRDILIKSSTIWGNLFCMKHDDSLTTAAFASEVLKRSGTSPLHLSISLSKESAHVSSFEANARQALFLETCRTHWPRISQFHVTLHSFSTNLPDNRIPATADFKNWAFLGKPAQNLQSFILIIGPNYRGIAPLSPVHFMSDTAPLLQEFVSTHFHMKFSAPWFSSLRIFAARQLILPQGSAGSFHLSILHALNSMTCVEHLRVPNLPHNDYSFSELEQAGKLPTIKLPSLCSLWVAGPLPNAISLASAIIGQSNDLSLTIEVSIDTRHHLYKTSLERLSKYFERTVNFHSQSKDTPSDNVFLVLTDHSVELSSYDRAHQTVYPGRFYFISIEWWRRDALGEQDLIYLANVYHFPYYHSNITTVCLTTPVVQWSLPMADKYIHLLSAFPSVTTLETDLLSFFTITREMTSKAGFLTDRNSIGPTAFFPALQTVRILKREDSPANRETYCMDALSSFLYARQDGGAPISLLEVQDSAVKILTWLPRLDKLVGLEIIFYDAEGEKHTYICGSDLSTVR